MRFRLSGAVFAAASVALAATAAADPPREQLTLGGALALAREHNPAVGAAGARTEAARGELRGARLLLVENPEIQAVGLLSDVGLAEVEVRQQLGNPAERIWRVSSARSGYDAAGLEADAAVRRLDLDVTAAFWSAVAAAERRDLLAESTDLAASLWEVAQARAELGADEPIVTSTARIRYADARRAGLAASADAEAALVRLVALLAAPDLSPTLVGDLPSATTVPPLDELLAQLDTRPDIAAARLRVDAADAAVRWANASTWPDLTVGARWEEYAGEPAWLGVAGLSIPIFERNQVERTRAKAGVTVAEADLAAIRLEAEADLRSAWTRHEAAGAALAIYDADVLRAQEESVGLLRSSFEAGKVDWAELVLLQRELVDARLGFVDARLELALADAQVRYAAGLPIADLGGDR